MKGLPFFFSSELETRSLESDTNKVYQSANESEQDLKQLPQRIADCSQSQRVTNSKTKTLTSGFVS